MAKVCRPFACWRKKLHSIAALAIVPLLAFLHSGIVLNEAVSDTLTAPVPVCIILGLAIGKQFGNFGAAIITAALGLGNLLAGVSWRQRYGASLKTWIGFTMSLFIASLAFNEVDLIASAKTAVLIASLRCAAGGFADLTMAAPR